MEFSGIGIPNGMGWRLGSQIMRGIYCKKLGVEQLVFAANASSFVQVFMARICDKEIRLMPIEYEYQS